MITARVTWPAWALALVAACSACWAGQPKKPDWRGRFTRIRALIREKQLPQAEKQIEEILEQQGLQTPQRLEAMELRGWVLQEQGKAAEALTTWRETEKQAAAIKHAGARGARYTEASKYFLAAGAWDDAKRAAQKGIAAARQADDVGLLAQMHIYLAILHEEQGRVAESQKARARMREILHSDRGCEKVGWVLSRLRDVGRYALAVEVVDEAVQAKPLAGVGDNLLQLGRRFRQDKEVEVARHCYELGARLPWPSPWAARFPRQCLRSLAELEIEANRLGVALGIAKLHYVMADVREMQEAMNLVARILKIADKDINRRVRPFLEYQRYGPLGRDGRPGTDDDLKDPLAEVPLSKAAPLGKLDKLLTGAGPLEHSLRLSVCMQHRRFDMALVEALAAYRAATGEKLTNEIYQVATVLKAADGHLLRANRYLMFQKLGPAGKDGKPGTADDLADPLQGVKLPSISGRDKLFAEAVAKCEDTPEGLKRKAVLLLGWGKCAEGLAVMKEIYARCGVEPRELKEAILGVAAALKAVDGHVHRANQYLLYQKYGPAGQDGIKGTADDPRNPLEAKEKG